MGFLLLHMTSCVNLFMNLFVDKFHLMFIMPFQKNRDIQNLVTVPVGVEGVSVALWRGLSEN